MVVVRHAVLLMVALATSSCSLVFSTAQQEEDFLSADAGSASVENTPDGAPGAEASLGLNVFATLETWGGSFARGSSDARDDANLKCNVAAHEAGLEGIYAAWLSRRDDGALSHIQGDGPWILTGTNQVVFDDHAQLTSMPNVSINRSEYGRELAPSTVWTGTLVGGATDQDPCMDWDSDYYICPNGDCYYQALTGRSDAADEAWTASDTIDCHQEGRLYCFEVDTL